MRTTLLLATLLLGACAATPPKPDRAALTEQVREAETAFAKSMADRDHAAFTSFLAEDTVFYAPGVQRGKAAVSAGWKRFFEKPEAPFSWKPEDVQVLDDGTLALSKGPVFAPDGTHVSNFSSIWRQEAPGVWKIIFDHGSEVCEAAAKK